MFTLSHTSFNAMIFDIPVGSACQCAMNPSVKTAIRALVYARENLPAAGNHPSTNFSTLDDFSLFLDGCQLAARARPTPNSLPCRQRWPDCQNFCHVSITREFRWLITVDLYRTVRELLVGPRSYSCSTNASGVQDSMKD